MGLLFFNVILPSDATTTPGSDTSSDATSSDTTLVVPPSLSTPISPPSTAQSGTVLEIDVSEDAWQGDAQFTVTVDGQQIGGTYTASASHSAGQTQAIAIPTSLPAGDHQLGVKFLNDAYNGSPDTDRNLYIDGVKLNGTLIANSSAAQDSSGTAFFNVILPSDATTTPGSDTSSDATSSDTTLVVPPSPSTPISPPSTAQSGTVLEIDVSEDAWQGDAQFTVTVDGQQIGGTYTASASHSAGQTQAIAIPTSLPAGDHQLGVTFLNDAYNGSPDTDRNLYIDGVKLNGTLIANSSAAQDSSGTAFFNVILPSDATTTPGSDTSSDTTSSGDTPANPVLGGGDSTTSLSPFNLSNLGLLNGTISLDGDVNNVAYISTAASLTSENASEENGGSDTIEANGQVAQVIVGSDNVLIKGGAGAVSVSSQAYRYGKLTFIAGSGNATLCLADAGNDNITLGSGSLNVTILSGQSDKFLLFAGHSGGTEVISGFRCGTDRMVLNGVQVASETVSNGSIAFIMSDHSQIQLFGLTSDKGLFS